LQRFKLCKTKLDFKEPISVSNFDPQFKIVLIPITFKVYHNVTFDRAKIFNIWIISEYDKSEKNKCFKMNRFICVFCIFLILKNFVNLSHTWTRQDIFCSRSQALSVAKLRSTLALALRLNMQSLCAPDFLKNFLPQVNFEMSYHEKEN
jgi:hypothetical protein